MEDRLVSLAYDVLAILIPALVALAVELLRRKVGVEKIKKIQHELEVKQELALLAVRFVEQTYKDLHGEDKYNKAASWLAERAQEQGIKITAEEIKCLIESALRIIKNELGEQWANIAS